MSKLLFILKRLQADGLALWDESIFRKAGELSRLYKFIHFWVLVWKSFQRNRCLSRAASLSYTTLFAIIPMLAVAVGVTSLFLKSEGTEQIEAFIQQFVDRMIPPNVIETNTAGSVWQAGNAAVLSAGTTGGGPVLTSSVPAGIALTNLAGTTNGTVVPPPVAAAVAPAPRATGSDARVVTAQKEAAQYIHGLIQKTYSGTLGVAGMLMLLFTAIMTLRSIEEAFNDIWGVSRGRDWFALSPSYITTIVGGPILLFGALALASGPRFQKTREIIAAVPFLEPLISQILPLAVICLAFALFYKLVPNTKVHFSAALVGGALAGSLWHGYNLMSFLLASRLVSYSRIYGSLALVLLFMAGLWAVWLAVLFGAQVAYAFQNRTLYLQEKLAENVNQRGREFVALRLMTCIGQRFQRGLPPPSVTEISAELGIPSRLVHQVLQTLLAAHLVVEVARGEPAYAPARPLEAINAHDVLVAMRATMGQELVTREEPVREEVYGEFARIQEAERKAASVVSILALVNRAQARLELAPPQPSTDRKNP
jgi:membrane protein